MLLVLLVVAAVVGGVGELIPGGESLKGGVPMGYGGYGAPPIVCNEPGRGNICNAISLTHTELRQACCDNK